jgi:hypothetical protein
MRTKAVYVLTSSPKDYYYEQLLMSVYSLKFYNPDMRTVLVTDTTTNETLVPGRNKVKEYFDDVIVVNIPKRFNPMQCSRYMKTSLRQLVEGDILFIDVDTMICDSLSEIDEFDVEIGAVPDNHHENSKCYNSGVMFSKDTSMVRELYELWHKQWLEDVCNGISTDQHSLGLANKRLGYVIEKIPDVYNCMIKSGGSIFWREMKIVHYFATCKRLPIFKIEHERSLLMLKKTDEINENIDFIIRNAVKYIGYESFLYNVDAVDYSTLLHRLYPSKYEILNQLAHVLLFVGERSKWLKCKLAKKRK